jgi:hypothetical protein
MAKRIEEIFEECLGRIEHGESIESCLASYPEEAQELEMMLRTFVNVKWRTTLVEPNPRFKAWGRAQLFNIYRQKAYQDEQQRFKQTGKSFLQRVLVPTIAGVVIFVLIGGVGTAAASSDAMPDQPLYPVKLATEEVRLALSFSDTEKAVVNTELAQRRAQEIAAMAELGKVEYIAPTTDRMLNNLENAEQAVNKVILSETVDQPEPPPAQPPETPADKPVENPPEKPTTAVTANITDNQTQQEDINRYTSMDDNKKAQNQRVRESYEKTVAENLAVLEAAMDKAPEDAKSTIQKALDVTRTKKETIENTNRLRWLDRNRNGIPDKDEIQRPDAQSDNTTSTDGNNLSDTENVVTDNTTDTQNDTGTGNVSNSNNSTAVSDNISAISDNATDTGKTETENGTSNTNVSSSANMTGSTSVNGTTANITGAASGNTDAVLIDESGADDTGNNVSFTNASSTTDSEKTTRRSKFWPWKIFR